MHVNQSCMLALYHIWILLLKYNNKRAFKLLHTVTCDLYDIHNLLTNYNEYCYFFHFLKKYIETVSVQPSTASLVTTPVLTASPQPSPGVPTPSQVQGVNVTQSGTSLTVSWTAVTHQMYNISYVVRYSTEPGTETDPPSIAMKRSGITATSATLTGLQPNTTYYVWVAAEIFDAGVQGPYSMRVSNLGNKNLEEFCNLSCLFK